MTFCYKNGVLVIGLTHKQLQPHGCVLHVVATVSMELITQLCYVFYIEYRQVSNIRRTLKGNKSVYHSDVVGASPVGAAPTTFSFST